VSEMIPYVEAMGAQWVHLKDTFNACVPNLSQPVRGMNFDECGMPTARAAVGVPPSPHPHQTYTLCPPTHDPSPALIDPPASLHLCIPSRSRGFPPHTV
jgi:hypothetical protein